MARARNIKPGFFKNEELGIMPHGARLLFVGLWTLADRKGRLEDRPARIAGELFAYNRDVLIGDIEEWLTMLADSPEAFIVRYSVGKAKYIQIANFAKHQSPHVKEQPSTIPAPDMPGASPVQAPDMHPPKSGNTQPRQCVAPPDCLNPDVLNPDVLNPDVLIAPVPAAPPPADPPGKVFEFPSQPQYTQDETYLPIVAVAVEFWPDSISEDFTTAHFAWKVLSWDQKQEALANLIAKNAAEPGRGGFVKKNFAGYMASAEWKRKAREPTQSTPKTSFRTAREQQMHEEMMRD